MNVVVTRKANTKSCLYGKIPAVTVEETLISTGCPISHESLQTSSMEVYKFITRGTLHSILAALGDTLFDAVVCYHETQPLLI